MSKEKEKGPLRLRALGFCGVDTSVNHNELLDVCKGDGVQRIVELGFLFRPEKEGQSRFVSMEWLNKFVEIYNERGMKPRLAAHLCSSRVEQVLNGDYSFIGELSGLGFKRFQINATRNNGVQIELDSKIHVEHLRSMMNKYPELEFIIQKNEETRPLWETLSEKPAANMSFLFDDSAGTGKKRVEFPPPINDIPCGYAGGIGPQNIDSILLGMYNSTGPRKSSKATWIDMESSLFNVVNGNKMFQLKHVRICIEKVQELCKIGVIELEGVQ